ncbi:hypothetical protein HAX54_012031, partial [Datura stramonium]|nr:hypothetical protein [Datura stramonium]
DVTGRDRAIPVHPVRPADDHPPPHPRIRVDPITPFTRSYLHLLSILDKTFIIIKFVLLELGLSSALAYHSLELK